MNPIDELPPILNRLRLSGILTFLELRTQQAIEDKLSHTEFLYRLLLDEIERRDGNSIQLRVKRANFEPERFMENFQFSFNRQIPKAKILDLATCNFIAKCENIAFIGQSGVGKSHLAQAIGHRACRRGFKVCYISATDIFASLRASRADRTYEKKLAKFLKYDLLILDDIGLRILRHDEPEDLYSIISQRYERASMIITSNRDISEWMPMFNNPLLASSALDRFLHHSHVINIEGASFRNPPPSKKNKSVNNSH